MNQFFKFFIILFISNNIFSQDTIFLNYTSDVPFQTSNESEYYHLESTVLIRNIINDIAEVIDKKNLLKDQKFTIIIKNLSGAVFPINYLVSKNPYNSVSSKEKFMEKSYDWFNRTFRSNFPYKD
tara:strand:+ start:5282 stop:5656 length:375 start_codon:yes stop_codon:yes gene_type:complete